MKPIHVILLLLSLTLAACSPKSTPEKKADEKPQGVLTDAQQQTLEKAKQTEQVLKEANEKRMKEVDAAEGK